MGKLVFILGGARSGKSTHAQSLASEHGGNVAFIATAQAGDAEMVARIADHQRQRPVSWKTLEFPSGVSAAWQSQQVHADLAVLDCLTFLVTNLLLQATVDIDHPEEEKATQMVTEEINALVNLIKSSSCEWIVVSNEVGLGLVPPYPLGRLFRDTLGWANQRLASIADEVILMVAGIPVPIHPYRTS
jgi:adenosylcobinamide kinase/adenosylcobinamide-phosphate guanylyltransferase